MPQICRLKLFKCEELLVLFALNDSILTIYGITLGSGKIVMRKFHYFITFQKSNNESRENTW